jgi:hypothetical protein
MSFGPAKTFNNTSQTTVSADTLSCNSLSANSSDGIVITGPLTVNGSMTTISTTNLTVSDKLITLNKGGAAASAGGSGIEFEENSIITGSMALGSSRNSLVITFPNGGAVVTIPGTSTDTLATQSFVGTSVSGGAVPAGSVTGTTLASNVVTSSLTTVGTLTNLAVTNPIVGSVTGSSATVTSLATHTTDELSDGTNNHLLSTAQKAVVTGATTLNTASTIVQRDGSGNFTAGTITANLTGNASGSAGTVTSISSHASTELSDTALLARLAGPTFSGTVTIPTAAVTTMSGTPAFSGNATAITQTALNASTTLLGTVGYTDAAVLVEKNRALAAEALCTTSTAPTITGQLRVNDPGSATLLTVGGAAAVAPAAGSLSVTAGTGLACNIVTNGTNTTDGLAGAIADVWLAGKSRQVTGASAFSVYIDTSIESAAAHTTAIAAGIYCQPRFDGNSGTITDAFGIIVNPSNANGGTITNGYGLKVSTPGYGTTKYTAKFDSGVGIGGGNSTTSGITLDVTGTGTVNTHMGGTQTGGGGATYQAGLHINPTHSCASAITDVQSLRLMPTWNPAGGTITTACGNYIFPTTGASGTITTAYGTRIQNGTSGGATVTSAYGLRVELPAFGTTKYAAHFDSGVGIGVANASSSGVDLKVNSGITMTSGVATLPTVQTSGMLCGAQNNGGGISETRGAILDPQYILSICNLNSYDTASGGYRWKWGISGAETGTSSGTGGSNLFLGSYLNDGATTNNTPITVTRSTGVVNIAGAVTVGTHATITGVLEANGTAAATYPLDVSNVTHTASTLGDARQLFRFDCAASNGQYQWLTLTDLTGVNNENTWQGTYMRLQRSVASGSAVGFMDFGSGSGVNDAANQGLAWGSGTTRRITMDSSGNFAPVTDNSVTCGASGLRWSAVWAANATIQTSDQRAKNTITDSPLGLDFVNTLRPVSYKFNVGKNQVSKELNPEFQEGDEIKRYIDTITPMAGSRTHYGLIAQELKSALDTANVGDCAAWVLTDMNNQDSDQGIRYEELISPMVKSIQQLNALVVSQASTISSQQTIIDSLLARLTAVEAHFT